MEGHVINSITLLAKSLGFSQKSLAEKCGVSRITIHRFFNGHTELRCSDFIKLLKILNIDVEKSIADQVAVCVNNYLLPEEQIAKEISNILSHATKDQKMGLLKFIAWNSPADEPAISLSLTTLKNQLDQLRRS